MRLSLFIALLGACVPAPSTDGTVEDVLLAGGSLSAGCMDGGVLLEWDLPEHPLVSSYVVVIDTAGGEFAVSTGAGGVGSAPVDPVVVASCNPGCAAVLYPVGADGRGDALLSVDISGDEDGDGYLGAVCGGTDCDDDDDGVHSGAVETCDGRDEDCSGVADDLPDAPLADLQAGVCAGATKVCDGAGGWAEPDYATYATAYEANEASCDGVDNDCNGQADDLANAPAADLQDGVCAGATKVCDGVGGWVEPDYTAYSSDYEATEASCDGLDNDCSGQADDLDGAPDADVQDGVCAGAKKVCDGGGGWTEPDYTALADYSDTDDCDGLDNDCDGDADDELSFPAADLTAGVCAGSVKVCDGTNGWVEPDYTGIAEYSTTETCDGLDNDCLGGVDDIAAADVPAADKQDGVCAGSEKVCDGANGWVEPAYTDITGYEADESLCDSADNDCDTVVDEIPGAPLATNQDGICAGSVQVCDGQGGWEDPDYTLLDGWAEVDDCDGLDNDCDGDADDEGTPPAGLKQFGVCAGSEQVCDGANGWVEPDYTSINGYESVETSCDTLDNDCDDVVDVAYQVVPDSGTLECWGEYTQVTMERVADGPYVKAVPNRTTWQAAEGDGFGCALDASGVASCWGDNSFGSLGDGTTASRRAPAPIPNHTWKHVAFGSWTACGLEQDDSLWCWGADFNYENVQTSPVRFGTDTWQSFDVGASHACGVRGDGTLWCWGANGRGELGDGTYTASIGTPVQVGSDSDWTQVSAGYEHTCGRRGQDVYCWGYNAYAQVGVDSSAQYTVTSPSAVASPGGIGFVDVSAGEGQSCALGTDDEIYCWGNGVERLLGDGATFDYSPTPVQALGGPWVDVETSSGITCGVDTADEVWCWGTNFRFDIDGDAQNFPYYETPHALDAEISGTFVPGWWASCGVSRTDGALWCWAGHGDAYGGSGPEGPRVLVDDAVRSADSNDGYDGSHECVVRSDSSLWCRGANDGGQLGNGTIVASLEFGQIAGLWSQVSTGGFGHSCAIDVLGARWCWGSTSSNALGLSTTNNKLPAEDTTTAVKWLEISLGRQNGCGITEDGALRCWGRGYTARPEAMDVGTWKHVQLESDVACAIDGNDDLSCWGNGLISGGSGTTTFATRNTVTGPFVDLAISRFHGCAIKDDQSLWCWGAGDDGRLGDGQFTTSYAPVQVPGTWLDVVTVEEATCALSADGTTWCWGANSQYGLGTDDIDRSVGSPRQVDTVTAGELHGGGTRVCRVTETYETATCPP
ncbi:MAG: hypothetical protein EP330_24285 [Deltaproteobacteria bacterium]|nr:MAG: hypothetical protein EP330_24285 [Deltaproteobacteria bacterium]